MKKMLFTLLLISGLVFSDSIQIKGSDTIVNLSQRLAEAYLKKNPKDSISVTGGGSGTGISALMNKSTDICNSSRTLKSKEEKKFKDLKMDIRQIVIAVDALSVIVNSNNPQDSISMEQLASIFKGDITNWSVVNKVNKPITLYGRQANSGTFDFFREHVLKAEYSNKMNQMNGNSQIVEAIRKDSSGIGYVGVAYATKNGKPLPGLKILKVSLTKDSAAYSPLNIENVYNGKYAIARGLQQYISGKPKGLIGKFITFELSKEGQQMVEAEGFYPVKGNWAKINDGLFK